MGVITTVLSGVKRGTGKIYDTLDNPETYKKVGRGVGNVVDFTVEAADNDIHTIGKLGKKAWDSDYFQDADSNKLNLGRDLSPKGRKVAYGVAGAIAAVGVADGFDKGEKRVIMGNIDADREGLPNRVTGNGSPIELSQEAIEEAMKRQGGHIKNLGADGELGLALHKLYGTGQQKFI